MEKNSLALNGRALYPVFRKVKDLSNRRISALPAPAQSSTFPVDNQVDNCIQNAWRADEPWPSNKLDVFCASKKIILNQ